LSDDLTLELRSLSDFWERHDTCCWSTPTATGWDSNENLRVWVLAEAEAKRRLADEVAQYGITVERSSARPCPRAGLHAVGSGPHGSGANARDPQRPSPTERARSSVEASESSRWMRSRPSAPCRSPDFILSRISRCGSAQCEWYLPGSGERENVVDSRAMRLR